MIARRVEEAQLALMLLTRLPAGRLSDKPPSFGEAAWAYPLVGALVGAIAGGFGSLAAHLGLPYLAVALVVLAVAALLTGGMHEDGLADVADGFGGGANRARKLEIMRDSRIGSYGVLALVLAVGLKATAIAELPHGALVILIAFTGAISRAMMILPMVLLRPARTDGLGEKAALEFGWRLLFVLAFGLGFAIVLGGAALGALLFAMIAALLFCALAKRQIGGQSGDVLGATQMICESIALLALVALL